MKMRQVKILCNFLRNYCASNLKKTKRAELKNRVKKKEEGTKSPCVKLSRKEEEKANIEKAVLEKFQQKAVRVSVIGADTKLGETTSFMLKQNPIVSRIFLFGKKKCKHIAADLNHMDTRAIVSGHPDDLPATIRGADIILLLGTDAEDTESSIDDKLRREGELLIDRATVCSYFAPRSVLVVCVDPIAVTLPLVKAVYQAGKWYHPGKVVGSVALSQMRANSLVASFQGLDPASVDVPLIGGPDVNTIVPLFTRARPVGLSMDESISMMKKFRGLPYDADINDCKYVDTKLGPAPFSEAFAINRMVTNIALGICGDTNSCVNAFVRTNAIKTTSHLTSTVRFGTSGLVHNYGLPNLHKTELDLLFHSLNELEKCERISNDYFLSYVEKKEEQVKAEAAKQGYR